MLLLSAQFAKTKDDDERWSDEVASKFLRAV
jgi:hypothetical protein